MNNFDVISKEFKYRKHRSSFGELEADGRFYFDVNGDFEVSVYNMTIYLHGFFLKADFFIEHKTDESKNKMILEPLKLTSTHFNYKDEEDLNDTIFSMKSEIENYIIENFDIIKNIEKKKKKTLF